MRKTIFFTLLVVVSIFLVSCGTAENSRQNNALQVSNIRQINPEEILERPMIGINFSERNVNDTYQLTVHGDGTFDYVKNGTSYNGDWSFDINKVIYRYVFEWFEEDNKQGYMVEFSQHGDDIVWMGQWLVTQAYWPMFIRYRFAD